MNFLRHYLLALQFFTRLPLSARVLGWVGYSPQRMRAATAHWPGVGWLVGAVAALSFAALALCLPDTPLALLVAAVFSTALTVLLTGALHEDGLSDVADGLGGAHDRARALEIMKDSRVGAFGVLALVLALLGKVGLLALLGQMDLDAACAGLFGAHVVSRFFPLLLIRLLPYVSEGERSKSRPLAEQIAPGSLLVALLWTVLALALLWIGLPDVAWWAPLLAVALAWAWAWRLFARRLQGYTGDCLGATQQVGEIAFYLGLALTL